MRNEGGIRKTGAPTIEKWEMSISHLLYFKMFLPFEKNSKSDYD